MRIGAYDPKTALRVALDGGGRADVYRVSKVLQVFRP